MTDSDQHGRRTLHWPSKGDVVNELKTIYTDPYVHVFILLAFGLGIAFESFVIAAAAIMLLSAWYIGSGLHHE